MTKDCLSIFVLLVFLNCANGEAPAERAVSPEPATDSPAAPSIETVVATGDSEIQGLRAEIHELRRGAGGILTLRLALVNESDRDLDFGYTFADPSYNVPDYGSIGGIYLIDAASTEKLPVMRDSDNRCICSRKIGAVPEGGRALLWAKFPASLAELERVSIMIPKFMPIDDVPVVAAEPAAGSPEPAEAGAVRAVAQGEVPGRRLEIREIRRGSGEVVDLRFTIVNDGDGNLSFGYDYADPKYEVTDHGSIGGVFLLDPFSRELYGVLRDGQSRCACSQGLKGLGAGERAELWAKFPAPPASTDRVSIVVPRFMPVDDVPLE
jgi:hypothetical protein